MVPLIRVASLRKRYGVHFVLDGVSLDVHSGEALALLGANGAGKTTLLRIIATLTRPSAGSVAVAGHDCVREAERVRRDIGYVGHGSHLYADLTSAENLRFWTALAGKPVDREGILNALATIELEAVADDKVRTLSAGMQRRLSLARLLLIPPRVLLLDEPFASLDLRAAKWLEEHLLACKARGAAVVMSTHSFGREMGVVDRVAILAEGRVALAVRREGLTVGELQRLYAMHVEETA